MQRALAFLLGLAATALVAGSLPAAASAFDLVTSASADRSGATALQGTTLSGNVYVFVSPSSGVTQVRFYLDDPSRAASPIKIESYAPWDFAGTASGGGANPYDSKLLVNGAHTITAAVDKSAGGTDVISSSFTVSNTTSGGCSPSPCADALLVSSSPSRSSPAPLDGKTVSGDVYVFVPANSGITSVKFYLDDPQRQGTPIRTESYAPFDFAGTASGGGANPYSTSRSSNGSHSITAAIARSSGVNVVSAGFTVSNGGSGSPDLLPDLVADAPTNPQPPAVMQLADGQNHLLLKFNGSMHNIGAGPLEIRGSSPAGGEMTVTGQRIYRQDGSFHDDTSRHPVLRFENTDGHNHWHLMNAARWSLWNQAGTAQVAPAAKVGFCLEDGEKVDSFAAPTSAYSSAQTQHCKEGQPNAASVFEGISSGWRDVYGANVYFQWIDVSDIAPGLYRLGAQMDPDDFVKEGNEANNGPALRTSAVTVPGYVASAVSASVSGPQAITLAAQQYGSPGARRFVIVSAPSHGTLSVATGTSFTGPQVTYSPSAGYSGPDSFRFLAYDSASQYPLHPPAATVSVTVSG
jgi:Lysyl oxidase/Bacterial Ig domain